MSYLQLILSVLSLFVVLLAAVLLLRGEPQVETDPGTSDARRSIEEIGRLLEVDRQPPRKHKELRGALPGSFHVAVEEWLAAVPQKHRDVVKKELSAQWAQSARDEGAMRKAVQYCLVKTDRDIDPKRERDALQKALRAVARLAGIEILDPQPGQIWPPHGDTSRASKRRVGVLLCRGLASRDGRTLYEPEFKEAL